MSHSNAYIFAGLAGLELDFEEYLLDETIVLSKTYAHLMSPYIMAFAPPLNPESHHPGPWKSASGGIGYDITAELRVPIEFGPEKGTAIINLLLSLFRLWCSPSISVPVISNISFSEAADAPDDAVNLIPTELERVYFPLEAPEGRLITSERLEWVKDHWRSAERLVTENPDFHHALQALDQGLVVLPSLGLVSLWGALELIFSPANTELRFRVSGLVAAYLEDFGEARLALQKKAAKLYDVRSTAAHGRGKDNLSALLDTFQLLRRAIIKMINDEHVPSKDELESRLFGAP